MITVSYYTALPHALAAGLSSQGRRTSGSTPSELHTTQAKTQEFLKLFDLISNERNEGAK